MTTLSLDSITADGELQILPGKRAVYLRAIGHLNDHIPSPQEVVSVICDHPRRLGILDLRAAETLEPESLNWIEQISALADAKSVRIRVVTNRNSKPRRLLELLRFDRFLWMASSIREALKIDRTASQI